MTTVATLTTSTFTTPTPGHDIAGDFPLDEAVIAALPPATRVLSCNRYGSSAWTVTARIATILTDGTSKDFFLKQAEEEQGRMMMEGEFHSMTELYKAMPSFVPEPYAWGKLSVASPETYFFLCQYINMANVDPDPVQFSTKLVELHESSISPTSQFGFHVTTCQGNLPQDTRWNSSWEAYLIQMIKNAMELNRKRNGTWKNLEQLVDRLITVVIPRLIRPLETDGRSVKPCLIHGDLWDGNIGTNFETGDIYIFDASVYYAHNEMEVAMWRGKLNNFIKSRVYMASYLGRMGISEPEEDFEDRLRVYSAYLTLHESACHNGSFFREECYETLNYLINKYAPFPNTESPASEE